VRFHIQQESDIPASTQLYNQICFAIAARHYPPGHRLPSTRQLAMQTGLHRNTISKVYRQLEIDGVGEAIAGSGIYVRDNLTKREFTKSLYSKDKIRKAPDQEAKKVIDNLISLGFTLQESREILNNEIDWRIKCGSKIIVSTPREDIGASMLIAEDLSSTVNVPVEVVPMEELEKVLSNSNNGTIVTSRYFLQPLEKVAKQHGVRAIAVDLSDFQKELKILKELNIFPEFIFGYESGTKIKIAEKLTQTYEILGFIEDRKKTLIDIKQNSKTSQIPCFLADWGYLKESDRYNLSSGIKLLKLENLGELVAI